VGAYYIAKLALRRELYDFIDVRTYFEGLSEAERSSERILLFRSEADVDLHLRDRVSFPYDEFQLTPRDLEKKA